MRFARTMKATAVLVVALAIVSAAAAGCQRKVEVLSGTRTVCSAGEVISDDVKTVKVPAGKAGAYRVRTVVTTCSKHAKLASLYAEAQAALTAKDTKLAAAKLAEVLAIDPTYRKAKEQAGTIAKGKTPAPDTSPAPSTPLAADADTTGTTPIAPPKPGETTETVGSLGKWTPDTIKGFVAAKPLSDALSVSREYTASGDSPASNMVIFAEQFRSAADASSGLEHQIKQSYFQDAITFKLNGRDAYFGTDGKRFAALGFTDGTVMVAIGLTTTNSPKSLRSLAEQVAKQLP